MTITFTDRYQALGIPSPIVETMCRGQCEGTGAVPVFGEGSMSGEEGYRRLWEVEHRRCSFGGRIRQLFKFQKAWRYGWRTHWSIVFEPCDGWHFVVCPDCSGSGMRV